MSRELQDVRDCILMGSHRAACKQVSKRKVALLLDLVGYWNNARGVETSLCKTLTGTERGPRPDTSSGFVAGAMRPRQARNCEAQFPSEHADRGTAGAEPGNAE